MSQTKKPTSLCEALGKGKPLIWQGQTIEVVPFDMNDIGDLEDAIGGDVLNLDLSRVRHQQVILWLVLRRQDETLTPDDRAYCRYKMSLQDFGRSIKAWQLNDPNVFQFILECVRLSGLYGDPNAATDADEETGSASKNADATSASTEENSSLS